MTCFKCGRLLSGRQRKWCSINCKNNHYVQLNREQTKVKAVVFMGGKCERCGWDEHVAGLQFHHRNPSEKEFGISEGGSTIAWEKVLLELQKCHLLCANCHAVVHATHDSEFLTTHSSVA